MKEPENPYSQIAHPATQATEQKSSALKEEPSRGCQVGCLLLLAAIFAFVFLVLPNLARI